MSIDNDAREFGQHFKQGGWRLGMLVARGVEHGGTGGRPAGNRSPENGSGKVSMSKFAEMADVSKSHVSYYFNAWQLAADAGDVPHAENMLPDDDEALEHIEEGDEHTRELWLVYYRKARNDDKDDEVHDEPTEEQDRPTTRTGSGLRTQSTPKTKVGKAVKALTDTSEQFEKRLTQVVSGVGPTLLGDDANLAVFVEELRRTRSVLDRYCQEIDQLLERIGFGDSEGQPEKLGTDVST